MSRTKSNGGDTSKNKKKEKEAEKKADKPRPERSASNESLGNESAAPTTPASLKTKSPAPQVVISPASTQSPPPPGSAETMPSEMITPRHASKSPSFDRLSATAKDIGTIEAVRSPRRQHSSRFHISDNRELEKLPSFHEVPTANRQDLFVQKLDQCNVIFDFNDASQDMKSKEVKREALHELLDYVANNRNVITEPLYAKVIRMVRPRIHVYTINQLSFPSIYSDLSHHL